MNIPLNLKFNIIKDSERRFVNLRKTLGESLEHIVLKLLAYLLFFDENLQIENNAFQHYKPDLVKFDKEQAWKVVKWIDCGAIDAKKLLKISKHNRQAEIYIFKSSPESAQSLNSKIMKKSPLSSNIHYFVLNKEQIDVIKQSLNGRNEVRILNKGPDYFFLNFNNNHLTLKVKLLL